MRFLISLRYIRNDNLFYSVEGKRWRLALASVHLFPCDYKESCHPER